MFALEVTIVVPGDIVPWCLGVIRPDARSSSASGLCRDLRAGIVEPPSVDHDLAILLTKERQHDVALLGPRGSSRCPRDFVATLLATFA
ncbi:streptomycin 3''-adenylyltransferase [Burkholderia ambifaria MEX-5]|uniref:Streptomycin 3''-adenylyltransferase n=1 Tax=Burkholderia ambifaria MEX-5 TaxID=396597 RepID=B1T5P2_9BURK|nr:hypothetical protein [Burkholderia ambifaria]EDT41123.1 streptomycin 3''-adenylyltransferase [Burkholderia ambifaria MEX-5]